MYTYMYRATATLLDQTCAIDNIANIRQKWPH